MIFLNTLPNFVWLSLLIPIVIFLINNRRYKKVSFSSVYFLRNLKYNQINRIKFLNILLLILRTLFIFFIILLVMQPFLSNSDFDYKNKNNKIFNIVYIDDQYTNLNGTVNGYDKVNQINDILNGIKKAYEPNSKLLILSTNQGIIHNGYNSNIENLNFSNQYFPYDNYHSFINDNDYTKKIHFISNFNEIAYNDINNFYNFFTNNDSTFKTYLHSINNIKNNQFIKQVKRLNNYQRNNQFEIKIGNNSLNSSQIELNIYKNNYIFDSTLNIVSSIPILSKDILLKPTSMLIDTIKLNLKNNDTFEVFFEINKTDSINSLQFIDDRFEDNTYSYVNNIPKEINLLIYYNDIESIKTFKNIINSFKINTNSIDTNYFKTKYILSNGFNEYSFESKMNDIHVFLGYQIFNNSSTKAIDKIINTKGSQILLFPNLSDNENDKIQIQINDTTNISKFYRYNDNLNYEEASFLDYDKYSEKKFNIRDYFYSEIDSNSILTIKNKSIWSKFKINDCYIDLFGFHINSESNFFKNQYLTFIPIFYDLILNDKINDIKYNLYTGKNYFNNIENDFIFKSINNETYKYGNKLKSNVYKKQIMGLINNDELVNLYSFNINSDSFDNEQYYDFAFPHQIIDYFDYDNQNLAFINQLSINKLIKYIIYIIFFILIIETYISNARRPKSN